MQNEIKANELRIGNWVQYQSSIGMTPTKVTSMNENGIDLFVHDYYPHDIRADLEYKYVKAIPLTPEILDKAGFEYDDILFSKGRIMLSQRKDGAWAVWYGTLTHGRLDECNITYLHQLQNLYYCLTSQELNIEL